jgi:hypothetical protein
MRSMPPNTGMRHYSMRHLERQEHHWKSGVALSLGSDRRRTSESKIEAPMAMQRDHQIVETPTEARQAEPGPSVLALLAVSTGLAVLILGVVWFVFFRT